MDIYDLQIYQGATYTLSLTLRDVNSNPIDLTSGYVSGYIKHRYSDTGVPISLNLSIQSPATSGTVDLSIDESITRQMAVGIGVYDVFAETYSGVTMKVLDGRSYVYPGVSF